MFDTSTKSGSSGIHIAVGKASGDKPYLGDPHVVGDLLRSLINGITERYAAVMEQQIPAQDAINADKRQIDEVGAVLAGENPRFEAVGSWNPEGLADYIQHIMPDHLDVKAANGPRDFVVQAIAVFALETYDVMRGFNDTHNEEAARLAFDSLIFDYTNLFLGLPVAAGDMAS